MTRPREPMGGVYNTPQTVNGRLGPLWHKVERVCSVAAGRDFSALLTVKGDVFVWGEMRPGELRLHPVVQCGEIALRVAKA